MAVGGAAMFAASGNASAAESADGGENLPPNVPEWIKQSGADTGSEPYGQPSKFEKGAVRALKQDTKQQISLQSYTPLRVRPMAASLVATKGAAIDVRPSSL